MFTYVNELAVVGTAFFMVAVGMVWYSEYLFQKVWMRSIGLTESDIERAAPLQKRNFVLTFLSYLVTIFLIALATGYAQVYGIAVQYVALGLTAGFTSLLAGFVIWEQRPLSYFLVTADYAAVFIVGSTFLLYYWPW